ncbi:MAG: tetratricopeptide repeat protein [Treponema sp.]|nr:tetratricopeptide repeat protein [Treponema sp.]
MTATIIIVLAAGLAILVFFLVKNILLPKKAAAAAEFLNQNNVRKAIRTAKAALEADPQNAEAHYLLGKAYLADKREEQAFREYRSASRLGIQGKNIPETEFRETLARLYAQFREEEEALKEYVVLIKQHPERPEYYFQAGKLFSGRGKPDLAEQYLRKASTINPREIRYRYELGLFYHQCKRPKEAIMEFDAALKLNPVDGQILLSMGKAYKDTKDYAGALPFLEKASREQEFKLRSLVELGGCYMSLNMLDKAIGELERAVNVIEKEAEPDSLYARYFLAMCFEKTQEFVKAIAQWDKIYAQKKNFRDVGAKLTQYIDYRVSETDKEASGPSKR